MSFFINVFIFIFFVRNMYRFFFFFFTMLPIFQFASFEDHLKILTNKTAEHSLSNIDFIYVINLDERPEKMQHTLDQLSPYGITPFRFPAVNGWKLDLETINSLATTYERRMGKERWGTTYEFIDANGRPHHEIMSTPGRKYYSHCLSRGAVGILLSHLSILNDAYNSGYETIWVLEDDIQVIQDPRLLPKLITKLDQTVGKNGWDILFTDPDTKGQNGQYVSCYSYAWRPDLPAIDLSRFARKRNVGKHFKQIGARYGAYSMIVRRSGMKKILDFFKRRSFFLPFDMEFTLPKDIRLFSLKYDIVSTLPKALSDNGSPNYLKQK